MTAPTLLQGDCYEVLQTLEADSVDSCVTDPPYGFGDGKTAGFMGKAWDRDVPSADMWRQVYRVLKPGAHLLSFFGTRTYHRGVVAIEDAGFEIRDQIGWLYGSGFPKSLDVSKAIDKAAGAEREVVGKYTVPSDSAAGNAGKVIKGDDDIVGAFGLTSGSDGRSITAPATEAAQQWDGWGTALKPAWEPVVVARKPLIGTVAQNVLEHGTGGINIDATRIGTEERVNTPASTNRVQTMGRPEHSGSGWNEGHPDSKVQGRWPANIITDGSDEVLAEFAKYGERAVSGSAAAGKPTANPSGGGNTSRMPGGIPPTTYANDTGTAARFFYAAKSSKDDRNDGLHDWSHDEPPTAHPTVKPTSLMRYLVRLVTPKGGLVLDPFAGSGTTLIAAYREDCRAVGVELDPDYFKMANHRIDNATAQLRLEL